MSRYCLSFILVFAIFEQDGGIHKRPATDQSALDYPVAEAFSASGMVPKTTSHSGELTPKRWLGVL